MIGVIGGTGLYSIEGLTQVRTQAVETPFGPPSAEIVMGFFESKPVAFLPRHGTRHSLLPSEINFRANIWALKSVGVNQVISVSAVGSLVKEIRPGDLALATQYLDLTKGKREGTFFGDGLVAHISTARPTCLRLGKLTQDAASSLDIPLHVDKTYACVEGPRLGTKAESFFLKGAGCDLVGMTNVPEAFLAREAQLCYCPIAVATDYDCWLDDPDEHVTLEKVMALYKEKLGQVQEILKQLFSKQEENATCGCRRALKDAVLTPSSALDSDKKSLLDFLLT